MKNIISSKKYIVKNLKSRKRIYPLNNLTTRIVTYLNPNLPHYKIIKNKIISWISIPALFAFLILSHVSCKNNPVSPPVNAGDTTWVKCQGLPDYYITDFAVSGNNLVAGTYNALASQAYVYISFNNGISWMLDATFHVNNKRPNNHLYLSTPITFLYYGNYLFAGIGGAYRGDIYISSDLGISWSDSGIIWPREDTIAFAEDINSFVVFNGNIFAGTDHGVFRSTDNGMNWNVTDTGFYYPAKELTTNMSYIFAGTNGEGIYRSSNNGINWIPVNTTNFDFYGLTAIGEDVFAGAFQFAGRDSTGGVFISTNNGINWSPRDSGLSNREVITLRAIGSYLFAGTNNGLFISTNEGENWNYLPIGEPPQSLAVISISEINSHIYVGTIQGAWRHSMSGLAPVSNTKQKKKTKIKKGG